MVARLLFLALVYGSYAWALEGFSDKATALPPVIQSAWNATVKVRHVYWQFSSHTQTQVGGTGFVVKYDETSRRALVATNAHVAGCPNHYVCSTSLTFFTDEANEEGVSSNRVRSVAEIKKLDLVILEVDLSKEKFTPSVAQLSPQPLGFAENAESAAIGYPALDERSKKAWAVQRPSDWSNHYKRFSVGKTLKGRSPFVFPRYPYVDNMLVNFSSDLVLTHNVDILRGDSGGPLVELTTGLVIGMNSAILNAPKDMRHCESPGSAETPGCTYIAVPSDVIIEAIKDL